MVVRHTADLEKDIRRATPAPTRRSPMTNPQPSGKGLTCMGKVVSLVLVLALVGLGAWMVMRKKAPDTLTPTNNQQPVANPRTGSSTGEAAANANANNPAEAAELVETKTEAPKLVPAIAYVPKDNVIDLELSEYAGYAGLIAANGGLEPSDNSVFAKKHGFKVRIKISEEESWNNLNAGKMAASATTADVLAVYGRQLQVVVPAQIGYSRGADGLVVRNDIKKINDLKGKVVAAAQFTEADFFIRYLAREASTDINMLPDLSASPKDDAINLVYCSDGLAAGSQFAKALKAGSKALAGAVTWAPRTSEIPAESGGKAKLLVSNKNLLIVADVLIVNRGFAEKNPDKVYGLVDGLLTGNKAVRDNPEANADVVGKAFKWNKQKTLAELQKVHLSNLPENQAFFAGGITQGGSFASIYQSAVLAYGNDLIGNNQVDSDRFLYREALQKAEASGQYKDQVASITPLSSSAAAPAETDPVLSKDIRFLFLPNEAKLDMADRSNLQNLAAIKRILDVAPGSRIILVGHVDNSKIPELMRTGGQRLVDSTALEAMKLSKDRATEVMNQLVAHEKVDPKRLEIVAKGWSQPVSTTDPERNRRVEVQWFTLE
jgi:NitT/TauT family transport system substrate-binding protein